MTCKKCQGGECVTRDKKCFSGTNLYEAVPGHTMCKDPDDCLDLELQAAGRTLSLLERDIFETEKHALTDWHARLADLHRQHFEAAQKYEAIKKEMQELHSPTPSTSDGMPF